MAHRDEALADRLADLMGGLADVVMALGDAQDCCRHHGYYLAGSVDKIERADSRLGELRLELHESIQNWRASASHPLGDTVVYAVRPE